MQVKDLEQGDSVHIDHDGGPAFPETYEVEDVATKDVTLSVIAIAALRAGCAGDVNGTSSTSSKSEDADCRVYTLRQMGTEDPTLRLDAEDDEVWVRDFETFDTPNELNE